jgi:hypothetical protein
MVFGSTAQSHWARAARPAPATFFAAKESGIETRHEKNMLTVTAVIHDANV